MAIRIAIPTNHDEISFDLSFSGTRFQPIELTVTSETDCHQDSDQEIILLVRDDPHSPGEKGLGSQYSRRHRDTVCG